jgi:hypothetical protein
MIMGQPTTVERRDIAASGKYSVQAKDIPRSSFKAGHGGREFGAWHLRKAI